MSLPSNGDSETSREEGQGTATTSERNTDPSSYTLKIRGGVEVDSHGKKAGKGPLIQTELSGTLGVSQDQTLITKVVSVDEKMGQTYIGEEVGNTLGARDYKQPQAVVYGLCSDGSNAMKSSNPHSGIYEAETTRTLDNNGGNPACNQGGMYVVQSMEVFHCTSEKEKVQPLKARDYKDPQLVCYGVDCYNQTQTEEVSKSLNSAATDSDHIPCVYGLDRASFNQGQNAQYDFSIEEEKAQTLVSRGPGGY